MWGNDAMGGVDGVYRGGRQQMAVLDRKTRNARAQGRYGSIMQVCGRAIGAGTNDR